MSKHIYKMKKISDEEYHVLEYAHGLQTDHPYVLAKCTGPVPASDIIVAMTVRQQFLQGTDDILAISKSIIDAVTGLEDRIRKYGLGE